MNANRMINEFYQERHVTKLTDHEVQTQLVPYLEAKAGKGMNRKLMHSKGTGGGQKYRLFWLTFDNLGNRNTPCYYFIAGGTSVPKMQAHGHKTLQQWLDTPACELPTRRPHAS